MSIGATIILAYLNETMKIKILENYNEYKDIKIQQLGIDSLSLFRVIMDIEAQTKKNIDYIEFDMSLVDTMDKINKYIGDENNGN